MALSSNLSGGNLVQGKGFPAGWRVVVMRPCAYCNNACQPTREHVIPDWYNDTPGEAETFSARAPLTHLKGDLLVKDVCSRCNNGVLAGLDGYGKELYERYFAAPVYWSETVTFDYDGNRLLRWLLKLSYNSARAQNADVRVLREFRKVMLGESPLPERIQCWVHLVGATCIDSSAKVVRPARREEQGQPGVQEPLWFRICQFRLTDFPALSLVQRAVVINSFCFTLLVARADAGWPSPEFDHWIEEFTSGFPAARPVLPEPGRLTLRAEGDHAAASMYPLLHHHPTRFVEDKNPAIVQGLRNEHGLTLLSVPRELIEEDNAEPIIWALRDMVSTREKAMAFRQRIGVLVDGYDSDARELWQVPEVRAFFRRLFIECPFVMLLAHPGGALLKLLAACWIYEEGLTEEAQRQGMRDFVIRAFRGLNGLNHTVMLSEEQNREISMAAAKVLFGEEPPIP
jgi:hypothetical protein